MKKTFIGILIAAVLGSAVFFLFSDKGEEPKFRMEKIIRGDIQSAVTAAGTVNPVTTVLVGTQVSGTVKDIYVDFICFMA